MHASQRVALHQVAVLVCHVLDLVLADQAVAPDERGWRETPILDRPDLLVGGPDMAPHTPPRSEAPRGTRGAPRYTVGPCIVEEYDATCVVPPGARAALDAHGNIVIELAPEGAVI